MTNTEFPLHTPRSESLLPDCGRCRALPPLPFDFTMAFQPIIDLDSGSSWAWEALVRGPNGESAASVLAKLTDENRYQFDQRCRTKAIELAHQLGLSSRLSINFLPNAVYEPRACIRATIEAANRVGFPLERLQFEITEVEEVRNDGHLRRIVEEYRAIGFGTAIDDFGAGYAGLNLLTYFQPDVLKLDMNLIRNIDQDRRRQLIVRHLVSLAAELPCTLIAEGVETLDEARCLAGMGIRLQQGYLYARPGFEALPVADPGVLAALLGS
ncbi:EAL domain-containing protein [Thauera mechernichensis]|uniref:EAL domain-containing protein n=2 Tax=Thauera TaxID=33057 RepID=A0ABW3WHS1_9RHOO|nr:EAL domain-containing protein [Thauera mechernichensis]MDG3064730.1 EAL domain-containing protein [Thauera mechernichensis]